MIPIIDARLYATCPKCGRRLCMTKPGSDIELECPKCQNNVLVKVDDEGMVSTKIIIPPDYDPKGRKRANV